MSDCLECRRKQKRIEQLEQLIANMARSADEVFGKILTTNVVRFPRETYAGRPAALREVPKR
jgi:hypothetical protein